MLITSFWRTVYLGVLFYPRIKLLFSYTSVTDWFL